MSSQIDSLSSQFNSLLTQYQATYQQFLNTINSNSTDISNNLMTIPNSSFIGQSNINTLQNSTLDNCVTSCTSTSSCSGATFNSQSNTCILSSGTGTIQSTPNKTAIVQQALYYSNQLQILNQQLSNLNNQMTNITNTNINSYNTNTKTIDNKAQILLNNYSVLTKERAQINEMVREFESLNYTIENGDINVTSSYYKYILLIIVAIFLIFVMFKYSVTSEQKGGGHLKFSMNLLFMFILLGLIIIFNSFIKK
jgi:NADH:ubiquinone oxidoreductase subunit 3 (subunit A)